MPRWHFSIWAVGEEASPSALWIYFKPAFRDLPSNRSMQLPFLSLLSVWGRVTTETVASVSTTNTGWDQLLILHHQQTAMEHWQLCPLPIGCSAFTQQHQIGNQVCLGETKIFLIEACQNHSRLYKVTTLSF